MLFYVLLWLAVTIAALWLYCRQALSKFEKGGVKHFKPLPIVGNMAGLILRSEPFVKAVEDLYFAFPKERFVGRYELMSPMVMVRDIGLIKKVTVKDFEYFLDHRSIINEKVDPIFGRNLITLNGQEWKDMRSSLSPAFTSSKIRAMVPFMVEVGDQMINSLKKKIHDAQEDYIDIDCKDLTTRYANDVIASCAFGLKVDSLVDTNNEFYILGKEVTNFRLLRVFCILVMANFPKLTYKLNIPLFPKNVTDFFKNLLLDTMKNREKQNILRPDMIHLLMEAKKGKLKHDDKVTQDPDAGFATVEESVVGKNTVNRTWTDDDLVAQAFLFFAAGFETVSSAMSFALHELAVNSDVQDKLATEIKKHDAKNGGKIDFNSIQNMVYMDKVVSEVLRLWPPAIATDRVCVKDYNLGKPNSQAAKDYCVRKGEIIYIPVWAIHRDPEFYPNPKKFDPERFSEEHKHKIKPFTYLPFGHGPRNCIGSRFALCEVKVMLYQLLLHMEVSPAPNTCIPAELATDNFNLCLKGGHWVRLKKRM